MREPLATIGQSTRRRRIGGIVAAIVGMVAAAAAVLFAIKFGDAAWRQHDAAQRFVPVDGVVLASSVRTTRSSKGSTHHRAVIEYSYERAGATYTSSRTDFSNGGVGGRGSIGRERAALHVVAHTAGSTIQVFVDPRRLS